MSCVLHLLYTYEYYIHNVYKLFIFTAECVAKVPPTQTSIAAVSTRVNYSVTPT